MYSVSRHCIIHLACICHLALIAGLWCVCTIIIFWPLHVACGILVPWPGIEPTPPALAVWSLNHWTAREVPHVLLLLFAFYSWGNWGSQGWTAQSNTFSMGKPDWNLKSKLDVKSFLQGFPGGTVVKNPPANAGDMGLSPGLGRSHMPRSN